MIHELLKTLVPNLDCSKDFPLHQNLPRLSTVRMQLCLPVVPAGQVGIMHKFVGCGLCLATYIKTGELVSSFGMSYFVHVYVCTFLLCMCLTLYLA